MMKSLLLLFLLPAILYGQVKTNLEIMYSLLDSAAAEIRHESSDIRTYSFEAGGTGRLFENRFASEVKNINPVVSDSASPDVQFVLERALVKYGEIYKDGLFGSFYTPRTVELNGNYLIKQTNSFREFNFTYSDSIEVDEIPEVENEFYTFTRGEVPPEPFFSSILEPVIAIGTTAAAVILFFTVRSR